MTEPRSSALPESAAESGTEQAVRPVEILPRLPGVEIKEEDRDLALDLAEYAFPGVTHIDQLTKDQKSWWILVAGRVLRGNEAIVRYVEAFSKVFRPSVDAQVKDILRRQELDFADKARRATAEETERRNREVREREMHKANLRRLAQQGKEDKERWRQEKKERDKSLELEGQERETRLQLEAEERRSKMRNSSRREHLAMGMAAITFACAVAAFIVGLANGEGWVIGGSGITGVAALLTIVKLLLSENRLPPPSPEEASAPTASP